MKKFIAPLVLLLIGITAFSYGYTELSKPWNHFTGGCPDTSTEYIEVTSSGCKVIKNTPEQQFLTACELLGALLILTGLAAGIYRSIHRLNGDTPKPSKKPTSKR